jgi:phosphatidylinositol 3-kinase
MIDANIPDIDFDTNRMAAGAERYKNIMRVQERFRLDLNDQQAMMFMQGVISESEKALFTNIHDIMHRWAQYWRD